MLSAVKLAKHACKKAAVRPKIHPYIILTATTVTKRKNGEIGCERSFSGTVSVAEVIVSPSSNLLQFHENFIRCSHAYAKFTVPNFLSSKREAKIHRTLHFGEGHSFYTGLL